ncbi:MFS transporter [Rouxiella silvae]|uniref:MFS transporter n=1 Tax=Rouxiella silvae TaxID=1646373 RepID=A0ABX3U1S0_9GAMM|nr:MFS transporter [Rouxiella silvae]ORJ21485.1 MFS transporter [Rouxiella silvae]
MRTSSAFFLLFGTLFMAGGYGATFLISAFFRLQGGSDIDAGQTLGLALIGTLIGVPLVGWFSGRIEASRLSAIAALAMSGGFVLFGCVNVELKVVIRFAALLIGLGWGMFYISAPMALSERITDAERGNWFTRFSAFQMAGICASPILLNVAIEQASTSVQTAFVWVGLLGVVASIMFFSFGWREPRSQQETLLRPWVRKITTIARSSAISPIIMVGLGGCVFSGMMSFQSSILAGTELKAATFYAVHAITVVASRLLLANRLSVIPRRPLLITLLSCLTLGLIALMGVWMHPSFHIAAAILTGLGYGLAYPVIQTWAINESAQENRHAALTWFVVAYFIGIFGFPAIGGWILVELGKFWFISALAVIALMELAVALPGMKKRGELP